jgi:hypothetical protein
VGDTVIIDIALQQFLEFEMMNVEYFANRSQMANGMQSVVRAPSGGKPDSGAQIEDPVVDLR